MGNEKKNLSNKREVSWFKVLILLYATFNVALGLHLCVFQGQWKTIFFSLLLILLGNLGVTAGAHRLWAHQTYKASTSLRIFLMLCHTIGGTGSIYSWVKIHRLHHKHFGTELDPFNVNKGFYFSHFKGFALDLSEAQEAALEEIDIKDIESDEVVMFQSKYYWLLFVVLTLLLPINAPVEYWGESLMVAVGIAGVMRLSVVFQMNLLIHSGSQLLCLQRGEKFPSDTNLIFFFNKTHWIAYHYLAPWDYKTGEYGKYGDDCTSLFIRICETLGYASDLRTADTTLVRDALVKSINENKSISTSLLELHSKEQEAKDLLFRPAKFL